MSWRTSLVVAVIVVVVLAAGCGGTTAPEPGNPGHKASDPAHRIADLGGGVRIVWFSYEGHRLRCVKWDDYHKGGLTCDFDAFHHQFGYYPHYYDNPPTDSGVGG